MRAATAFELGDRHFDDGYDKLPDGAVFSVSGGTRTLTVTFERGYPVGQIFAPAGSSFICFEPMTAQTNALRSGVGLRRAFPAGTTSRSSRSRCATGSYGRGDDRAEHGRTIGA